jgi:cytochrome c oxidase subunit 2
MLSVNLLNWKCDASVSYQLGFQDPATTIMEGIFLFNLHLLFVILSIVIVVAWLIYSILVNFTEFNQNSVSNFVHSNIIEIGWINIPALILLSLASPSFFLLYSLDESPNPALTLKIEGHQWYWTYEVSYSDFQDWFIETLAKEYPGYRSTPEWKEFELEYCNVAVPALKYSSYVLTDEFLKENNSMGFFRNLETNKRIVLPTNTHIRLLVTSVDVLHSWTIPSFGIKIDACPGRLNQANLFIKRFGLFFGQCSEICGVNHGFMPIVVLRVSSVQYNQFIASNL